MQSTFLSLASSIPIILSLPKDTMETFIPRIDTINVQMNITDIYITFFTIAIPPINNYIKKKAKEKQK
jgi:hypothetical protein